MRHGSSFLLSSHMNLGTTTHISTSINEGYRAVREPTKTELKQSSCGCRLGQYSTGFLDQTTPDNSGPTDGRRCAPVSRSRRRSVHELPVLFISANGSFDVA